MEKAKKECPYCSDTGYFGDQEQYYCYCKAGQEQFLRDTEWAKRINALRPLARSRAGRDIA